MPRHTQPDVLSAREEPAGLGHLVSDFSVGAQLEGQSRDADYDPHEGGRVHLPVGGLGVPATGG